MTASRSSDLISQILAGEFSMYFRCSTQSSTGTKQKHIHKASPIAHPPTFRESSKRAQKQSSEDIFLNEPTSPAREFHRMNQTSRIQKRTLRLAVENQLNARFQKESCQTPPPCLHPHPITPYIAPQRLHCTAPMPSGK